jgi:hypothetical protein
LSSINCSRSFKNTANKKGAFFEIIEKKKKKMYCAFVDFEKAFDNIWRVALWYKLLLNKWKNV